MAWQTIRYERDKLYEEVWTEPMLTVAARYGVSSVALAKTCRKLTVPTPPRGYWALKAVGRAPARPRLPATKTDQRTTITTARWNDPNAPAPTRAAPQIEADESRPPIVVGAVLEEPHNLTRASLAKLRRAAKSRRWEAAPDEQRLDIRVTPETMDRAVLLMDTLLKELEARGFAVEATPAEPSPGPDEWGRPRAARPSVTRVNINGDWVNLCIFEMTDNLELPSSQKRGAADSGYQPPAQYERRPNGRLCFRISEAPFRSNLRQTWRDGKAQRLERCLADVVRGILTLARALLQERSERERKRREAAEAERMRQAELERRRLEQQKLDDLASRVLDHVQAEEIRGFLRAVEAHTTVHGPVGPESEVAAWMDWARGVASSLQENAIRTLLIYRPARSE